MTFLTQQYNNIFDYISVLRLKIMRNADIIGTFSVISRSLFYLRHSLYLATCMASMTSPTFSSYVAKKKEQGKHYYVAIGHAMKKMIRIIFHVLKTGKSFVELSA